MTATETGILAWAIIAFTLALFALFRIAALREDTWGRLHKKADDSDYTREREARWALERKFDALQKHLGVSIEKVEPTLVVRELHK